MYGTSSRISTIFFSHLTRTKWNIVRIVTKPLSTEPAKQVVLEEIYTGALTKQIYRVKLFSLSTSAMGVLAQPILYRQATEVGGGLASTIALGSIVGFFTFVTPLLLHFITKKYIASITYDKSDGTYTATVISFFLRKKQIKFKPEDVIIPDVPGFFTTFKIKNRPLFVDAALFQDTSHYIKIMGYDKPIDFTLEEVDSAHGKKSNEKL